MRWAVFAAALTVMVGVTAVPASAAGVKATSVVHSTVTSSYQGWVTKVLSTQSGLYAVSCPSASVCYAAGGLFNGDSTIEKTVNGGTSWGVSTFTATSRIGTFDSISCPDSTHCLATGGGTGGTAYRTVDGVHWARLTLPSGTAELTRVTCLGASLCWASSPQAPGVQTTNFGTTWSPMPYHTTSPGGVRIENWQMSFTSSLSGWIVGGQPTGCTATQCRGFIQHTNDGGHTWAFASTPSTMPWMDDITCTSASVCMAFGDTFTQAVEYRTTNSGASWSPVNLPAGMREALATSCSDANHCSVVGDKNLTFDSKGNFVTSDAAIARTVDGGRHWSAQQATGGLVALTGIACPSISVCVSAGYTLTDSAVALTTDAGVPPAPGYWLVASDGGIFTFGSAHFYGSTGAIKLNKPIEGMAVDPATGGYWMVASDGGIFSFHAPFHGSTGAIALVKPVVGMAVDPVTDGYWLVASDGGIFSFDAPYYGSMGGKAISSPIVGITPTSDGGGYWLVARNGTLYPFGSAKFESCTGAPSFGNPTAGVAIDSVDGGYRWASSAGQLELCQAPFYGDVAGVRLAKPVVGIATDPVTGGYWMDATDGGIFAFNAPFLGSTGAVKLNRPIVGMAAAPAALP